MRLQQNPAAAVFKIYLIFSPHNRGKMTIQSAKSYFPDFQDSYHLFILHKISRQIYPFYFPAIIADFFFRFEYDFLPEAK